MVLTIVEISQKQAYIFTSNKLRENAERSAEIAWVTSSDFFKESCKGCYDEGQNLVYAGGGHTVLCFSDESEAKAFNMQLTQTILKDFPDMELFTKNVEYDDSCSPSENLTKLTQALEKKKAIRRASFKQGTFGVEQIDRNSFKPVRIKTESVWEKDIDSREKDIDRTMIPSGYRNVNVFEKMTIEGGKTNFLAIVHIDGNGMGARINRLYEKLENEKLSWDDFRKRIREYSDRIDADYKEAYKEMLEDIVCSEIMEGKTTLPIRRIIISGDDICFAADGKLGIEAARVYIEKLTQKTNEIDGEKYAACAGVSITHIKYPFFRSYEMAEELCSNAKKHGALISPKDNGASISLIDWHISFGEFKHTLEEERVEYKSKDEERIIARPYIVNGDDPKGEHKSYEEFKKVFGRICSENDSAVRSKIKGLRNVMKQSEYELKYYKDFYHLEKILDNDKGVLFDAIETMDLCKML